MAALGKTKGCPYLLSPGVIADLELDPDVYEPLTRNLDLVDTQPDINQSVWRDFVKLRDTEGKFREVLFQIRCDTLIIHGDHDPHVIQGLILMAAADGVFHENEKNLIGKVGVTLNIDIRTGEINFVRNTGGHDFHWTPVEYLMLIIDMIRPAKAKAIILASILISLAFAACAHNMPNYQETALAPQTSRITIYWPRQWQSQWARFDVKINGQPVKRVLSEGYFAHDIIPGEVNIQTSHFQEPEFIVITKLSAKTGKDYYFRIDTEPQEVTALGVISDVLSISTVVAGMKSELKIQSGQATWQDLNNIIQKEAELAKTQDRKPLSHHVLVPTEPANAKAQLAKCCSSERVLGLKSSR